VALLAVLPFAHISVAHPWAVAYFGLIAALSMGLLGLMAAIWSVRFDHIAAISNFVVMPMTFLSGTFYVVDRLPEPFRSASRFNPFFYMISGFRYGFIGTADGSLLVGVLFTAGLTIVLAAVCLWMFATGYRLKT
jgi:ABC-2 type transport system permease protein